MLSSSKRTLEKNPVKTIHETILWMNKGMQLFVRGKGNTEQNIWLRFYYIYISILLHLYTHLLAVNYMIQLSMLLLSVKSLYSNMFICANNIDIGERGVIYDTFAIYFVQDCSSTSMQNITSVTYESWQALLVHHDQIYQTTFDFQRTCFLKYYSYLQLHN